MASSPPQFELHPAEPEDAEAMAQVGISSFAADTHTLMKSAAGHNPMPLSGIIKSNESYISNPKVTVIKAVDAGTGELIGSVCWGRRDGTETFSGQAHSHAEEEPKDSIARLEGITNRSMEDWMARIMPPGTKCMFIVGIAVAPAWQGRGVGRALIRSGTESADAEGLLGWVHASEAGWRMFEKSGFRERERLEVDLDEFAQGTAAERKGEEEKWGKYVFRYMVREPVKS